MSTYKKNLQYLKKNQPQFFEMIQSLEMSRTKTEKAKNSSLTLIYKINETPFYLHSKFNPEKESEKILQNIDLDADHIIVLGLGLGYHLEKIMVEKDPLSRVLLVEPDLELVKASLNVFPWYRYLDRNDLFFVFGNDMGQLADTLHIFISMASFEKVEFVELSSETRLLSNYFSKAKETLDSEIKTHLYDFKTHLAESYMVPRNILKNLFWILKSRPITHLKNVFSGVPGFIISAGPSLDKNVLYLKKVQDRGILISVDTALKPLLKRSIQPHFTTIGDPSYKNYLHLQGMEKQLQYFIVAEAGIATQVFKDFQDKIFSLSIGKPIVKILESNSEPLGEIEAWGSVISIALDFAVYMGLNPIVFVGQDFAFTDNRNHCRGTSWEEKKMEYSRSLDQLQRFETISISGNRKVKEVKDIYGEPTFTSERLELYKNFLVRLLARYPKVQFINATQGGILSEIPQIPLQQVIKKIIFGKKSIDFDRIQQFPTLTKRDNITRLIIFLSRAKKFFEEYLHMLKDSLQFLESNKEYSPRLAFPKLQELERIYQHLYSKVQNGEIVEMWSAAPIYHFLKEYKRIRNQPLDETVIKKSFEIYQTYFENIKPLVEDIIKQFKRTAGKLVGLESGSEYGSWLIRLRDGAETTFLPHNTYMLEAMKMRDMLYTIPEIKEKFPNIFKNSTLPLVLEVGCYMGHTVIELAENNPGINVLGMDIKYKRVVKSSRKIKKAKLSNAKIVLADVMELLTLLPAQSVYGMFIFFPDPWIKQRHERFRFLNQDFFKLVSKCLKKGGFIWFKTDQKNYFDEVTSTAKQHRFYTLKELPGNISKRPYQTVFEEMFKKKNIPYYQVILSH